MSGEVRFEAIRDAARTITVDHERVLQLWRRRGLWQIKIRWIVAPLIVAAALAGRALGFQFPLRPILVIAAVTLLYNLVFFGIARRETAGADREPRFALLATVGIVADYAALVALLFFTGGASSPLLVFIIFHVIIAAIQFPPRYANTIAATGSVGLWILLAVQIDGWLPAATITLGDEPVHTLDRPIYLTLFMATFTATLFMTVALVGKIMRRFRRRVVDLAEVTTKLGAAKDALERLDADRTRFMLQVAHNLRAPLGAGLSMLGVVQDGTLGPVTERQTESLSRIERRLSDLNKTIGEILTIGKARDLSREITDVVIDLKQLARRTEATFRDEAARKGLRLKVTVEDDLPAIDSGANLLEQVMENLVSNAIKYTPEDGEVEVHFACSGDNEVRITVRDSGIGIPEQEQEKLFSEFFRATNARKVTPEGSGLGLVLVKKTVERHHGRVRVASRLGEGTTVTVDLPVRQPHAA